MEKSENLVLGILMLNRAVCGYLCHFIGPFLQPIFIFIFLKIFGTDYITWQRQRLPKIKFILHKNAALRDVTAFPSGAPNHQI